MKQKNWKILFVCTEDWFFRSHFYPLNRAAQSIASASILCNTGEAKQDLEDKGLHVLPLDFSRRNKNPISAFKLFWRLVIHFRREKPALIHFIALRPVLIGGLAAWFFPSAKKIYHVTGLGTIAEGKSTRARLFRGISFRLLAKFLELPDSHLIVENPDDLEFLREFGSIPAEQVSLFGGAGVDPDTWPLLPLPKNQPPRIVFVGRMIWTKGVDILVEAVKYLNKDKVMLQLDLYGEPDQGNPNEISLEVLRDWNNIDGINWHGRTDNVREIWRGAELCVISTRTREGMPRSMLEAAACGRPLIVTDVPGCRHFVRNGIEGYIVPPENALELANAMKTLANDVQLQQKMGKAARRRVLDGYTESDVFEKALEIYRKLLT